MASYSMAHLKLDTFETGYEPNQDQRVLIFSDHPL